MSTSNEPVVALSASRVKTCMECSWKYHCKYKGKLPETSNDGASRGTICHAVLENLGIPKRRKYYNKILKEQDVFAVPSVGRLVMTWAKRLNVSDPENLELINFMTVNGLNHDYFGNEIARPTHSFSERDFNIVVNEYGKKYKIRGFIDKLFLYKGKKIALIRDFKTSKKVFSGKEATDNLQDLMYSLAVKHLHPEYKTRQSEFLFLKFELGNDMLGEPNEGVLKMEPLSDDELEGFEYQLTEWQNYLDNFGEEEARSNFAADQPFPSDGSFSGPLSCGFAKYPGQLKKDGNIMWHCAFKFPFDYYEITDEEDNFVKNILLTDEDSLAKYREKGYNINQQHYDGCPRHMPSQTIEDEFSL